MIGVINPNASVSLAAQRQNAAQSLYMLAPGQPFPSEGQIPAGDHNPAQPDSGTTSPTSSASSRQASKGALQTKLSNGAIAGIVLAAVFVVCILGALFFLLGRHKTIMQLMHRGDFNDKQTSAIASEPTSASRPASGAFTYTHRSTVPSTDVYGSPISQPYQDPNWNPAPPYAGHPAFAPTPALAPISELQNPGDKALSDGHIAELPERCSEEGQERYHDVPAAVMRERGQENVASPEMMSPLSPSPPASPMPISWWGKRWSMKTP